MGEFSLSGAELNTPDLGDIPLRRNAFRQRYPMVYFECESILGRYAADEL